jgi:hypothetical protein
VELLWTPTILKAGQDTNFGIVITDVNNNLVPNAAYEFKVMDKDNKALTDLNNQQALDGTGKTTYKFPAPGLYHIYVSVLTSTSSYMTDMFAEFVTFDLSVT